jgi:cysteinyl-tRNA synthetase
MMHAPKIFLTNTLTRRKEEFIPLQKNKVGIYHCGPTVYWNQHIGNMRAVVLADIIRKTFEYAGYQTLFIRNYTDVGHLTGDNLGDADSGEDRMTKAAEREHISPDQIAEKYIQIYEADTKALGIETPNASPRATEYINEMITMVQKLIDTGHAYITPLAVYFDITTYPEYTKLSGQKIDENRSGSGHGTISDSNKKHPSDFALWIFKAGAYANALQTWTSPFESPVVKDGEGFPGWHIECSAMTKHFLGPTFDVHIGGIEHIPVHHTNEIAQSVCANKAPYATYWLHNEHLLVDNKKMSKSEGTSYLLEDIVKQGFSPMTLRYFFLQAHYRSKQNFTLESLQASDTAFKRLCDSVAKLPDEGVLLPQYVDKFNIAIFDDFNTSSALAVLWDLLKDQTVNSADKKTTIIHFDTVLGLQLSTILPGSSNMKIPEEIQELIQKRKEARIQKDWVTSDKIRDILLEKGFEVTDTGEDQILIKK